MIAPEIVEEIHRLLAADELSQRKIAERLGISRTTIYLIASGQRPDYELRRRQREEQEALEAESLEPPQRCRECGGMVRFPCRLCRVRAEVAKNRARASTPTHRLAG